MGALYTCEPGEIVVKIKLLAFGTALALVMSGVIAGPSQAQTLLTGSNTDEILAAAKVIGTATMATQQNGDPLINGTVDGSAYQIYFKNCTANASCEDLNFYVGFSAKPSLDVINDWNRDKRFSRAYLDEVADAVVEMDLDLVQGVTSGYLTSQFDLWRQVVAQFATHIGAR